MSRSLDDILRDRRRLRSRGRVLRARFTAHAIELQRPLVLVDRVQAGVRKLMARPAWTAGVAAAAVGVLVALGPRRAFAWGAKGWAAWRLWRNLFGGTPR